MRDETSESEHRVALSLQKLERLQRSKAEMRQAMVSARGKFFECRCIFNDNTNASGLVDLVPTLDGSKLANMNCSVRLARMN